MDDDMDKTDQLLSAIEQVQGSLVHLGERFEAKASADELRFAQVEHTMGVLADETQKHSKLLSDHATLHTNHAKLITTAQELALKALQKNESAKAEHDAALKGAIDIQNKAIGELAKATDDRLTKQDGVLTEIVDQNKELIAENATIRTMLLGLAKWTNHPLVKLAFVIGGLVGGYLAARK